MDKSYGGYMIKTFVIILLSIRGREELRETEN
jgi:hypothetical protein